jgi:hypothetical protein
MPKSLFGFHFGHHTLPRNGQNEHMLERWTTARSEGVAVETPPEKAGLSICQDFFYSSFCQAKLGPGVLENYATKDSKIGIQKEQLFPRQFGKSSSFAIFPRRGS